METRSQRQQNAQRPPYPQISTTASIAPSDSSTSSAFNSSSSVASLQTPGSTTSGMQPGSAYGQQASAAPLPSPLVPQQSNYFGSIGGNTAVQQTQASAYVGQRAAGGGVPETAPFLDNFNLVAEAAKRAQMACLMRDLGDVEL